MLTARDDPVDRVVGLEVGADDYVTKPFSIRELVARIGAQLRRASILRGEHNGAAQPGDEEVLTVGGITVDAGRRTATLDGERLPLKRREFDLLAYMALNAGIVLSRDRLLTNVWADELEDGTRTVDVHVRRLRRHIEPTPDSAVYIHTVRGTGYVLRGPSRG
jgi:DNA-binding response OmpR family regulator